MPSNRSSEATRCSPGGQDLGHDPPSCSPPGRIPNFREAMLTGDKPPGSFGEPCSVYPPSSRRRSTPKMAEVEASAPQLWRCQHPDGSEHEHALACCLGVEQAIRFGRLVEREAMGQQAPERDTAIDDEAGALGLADRAERPRPVDSELLVNDVGADVERRGVALADEADPTPDACAL